RLACFERADEVLSARGLVVDDWSRQKVAKAVAAAYQRASLTLARHAQGEFEPDDMPPTRPVPATQLPRQYDGTELHRASDAERLTLSEILEDWWREAKAAGRKPSTYESYRNTINALARFLNHDDAARVTPKDIIAFKDHRLSTPSQRTGRIPSAKTVKDSDLAALKTLFGWAVVNHRVSSNPAAGATIKLGKAPRLRSKGFTDAEAHAILSAAFNYRNRKERPCTAAAKRWVPWLCAFTGARVGEMAQLRRQDVRRDEQGWVIHITPEAGTQKTNEARDVPLHSQLVEIGFPDFVEASPDGHLFLTPGREGDVLGPLQGLKNRLAEFARSIVSDTNVAPNHGWRHRFKTSGLEAEIDHRVLDEIQGQAARSVAGTYGEASLRAKRAAISKLPSFPIGRGGEGRCFEPLELGLLSGRGASRAAHTYEGSCSQDSMGL
ncbi:phage integrase N-terminal SAM-like domain-containing protein, partial [Micromonospora sp. STR1s_5]|nr:phage integrase N-terminal SAM-like domain-containing protein [Micromonospora sp. STR1s_5]